MEKLLTKMDQFKQFKLLVKIWVKVDPNSDVELSVTRAKIPRSRNRVKIRNKD